MTKIFADTDVIIDFLTKREPFAEAIKELFQAAAKGKLQIHVSSTTIVNTNYIIGRIETPAKAFTKIKKLLKLVHVQNVGAKTIGTAVNLHFKDFEGAIQNACATQAKLPIIVTRNIKDYAKSELSVLTPKELLVQIQPQN